MIAVRRDVHKSNRIAIRSSSIKYGIECSQEWLSNYAQLSKITEEKRNAIVTILSNIASKKFFVMLLN